MYTICFNKMSCSLVVWCQSITWTNDNLLSVEHTKKQNQTTIKCSQENAFCDLQNVDLCCQVISSHDNDYVGLTGACYPQGRNSISQFLKMIEKANIFYDFINSAWQVLLTQWGRVTHIYVIIDSDNGLTPSWRQAIIWTNARILLIQTLQTNFSEILSKIHTFLFKKMCLKILFGK